MNLYKGVDILKYLRTYEKYPQLEYLMKAGLSCIAFSTQVLKKVAEDKSFCKWLIKNRDQIARGNYYVSVILRAYKTGKEIDFLQSFYRNKLALQHDKYLKPIRELFRTDLERFFLYIDKQNITANLYLDYLKACQYLGLDMTEDKNRYPHDFGRWHDIRIVDSNGIYDKLWKFSSFLVARGFRIVEVGDETTFEDGNIPKTEYEPDKMILRACSKGEPIWEDGNVMVKDRYYVLKNN